MIYTFKSRATADVIMRQSNAEQMLAIIGKEATPQGVITVAQMPAAITALNRAIEVHEDAEALRAKEPSLRVEVEGDSVRLRDRAAPFIELLRQSAAVGMEVLWGV
ncbi:DUF1840 domain-containing protein [Rhodoferax sp.]|uniref:DUF1840 domain-containing protein n=1 Tax=Rhodoferax sp. TaxID=50421 RepID=UPI00284FD758|nr:DUF1840 domain-containing protein [Rhodoferax sp.]MDR3370524.1 DUF1840 domain-containing protein [Rhodoferax sp.]